MSGTIHGTLAAVSTPAIVPNMAQNLGFGEVAEWFKAAVLKTSAENIRYRRFPAGLAHFRARSYRVPPPFPKNIPSHKTAQSGEGA